MIKLSTVWISKNCKKQIQCWLLKSKENSYEMVEPDCCWLDSTDTKVRQIISCSLFKVQNAVSVIGKALGGSSDNLDKKSSTLPRRKSKADFVQPTPFIVPMPSK